MLKQMSDVWRLVRGISLLYITCPASRLLFLLIKQLTFQSSYARISFAQQQPIVCAASVADIKIPLTPSYCGWHSSAWPKQPFPWSISLPSHPSLRKQRQLLSFLRPNTTMRKSVNDYAGRIHNPVYVVGVPVLAPVFAIFPHPHCSSKSSISSRAARLADLLLTSDYSSLSLRFSASLFFPSAPVSPFACSCRQGGAPIAPASASTMPFCLAASSAWPPPRQSRCAGPTSCT